MTIKNKLAQARQAYLLSAAKEASLVRKLEAAKRETETLSEVLSVLEQISKQPTAPEDDNNES